jgi:5'-3' exonuclease
MTLPLLVIDGDSFAHRSYHALPKTIRRRGNKGGGAILGFANFLLRLNDTERPRAVLAAWDTLDEPTYRHRALADYQSGREFDTELIDQTSCPRSSPPADSPNAHSLPASSARSLASMRAMRTASLRRAAIRAVSSSWFQAVVGRGLPG